MKYCARYLMRCAYLSVSLNGMCSLMKNRIVLCCLCAALGGNVSALMLSGGGSYTRYNNGISTDNTRGCLHFT